MPSILPFLSRALAANPENTGSGARPPVEDGSKLNTGRLALELAVFALLLALFLLLATRSVSSEPFVYDEADYMYAASLGFLSNWTDTPFMPLGDFVRAGLGGDGRKALSERIRGGNDVLFYRHFHGPLFQYLLIPLSRSGLSEHAARTAMLAIPAASLAVIYFGCLWIIPNAALLSAMLFLTSYAVIASSELAPHQFFALCSLVSLIMLVKAIATGLRRYWYGAVVAAGLAFATLEIAIVLLLVLAICCFVERRPWYVDRGFVAKSVALFVGTVLAVWPAAILRLSFIKSYAVMAYLSLSRHAAWGDVGFLETWRARFVHSPLEWMFVLAGVLVWIGKRRSNIYPVGLFALLAMAATLRVLTETPRYSLAFMPALDLLAGLALVPFFGPLRRPASLAVVALAVAGLYGGAWYQAVHQPHNPNPRSAAVVSYIHQNQLENKAVWAPHADVPTLHYYFPHMRVLGYFGQTPAEQGRGDYVSAWVIPATGP